MRALWLVAVLLLLAGGSTMLQHDNLDTQTAPARGAAQDQGYYLEVKYGLAMQPLVKVAVGGQLLNLVFDASSGNTVIFVKEKGACVPRNLEPCYSYEAARAAGTVHICKENNEAHVTCELGDKDATKYKCETYLPSLDNVTNPHEDQLIIDGVRYDEVGVEAVDMVTIPLGRDAEVSWPRMPIRLLVKAMAVDNRTAGADRGQLQLFEGTDGILGASGETLGCQNETIWGALVRQRRILFFAFDLQAPPQAKFHNGIAESRIVLNHIEPQYRPQILWSQPKQTGDILNDGMHEFLIYHPHVCGVDLLYNVSSNWLAVIDTSGPCLSLPPFIFDSLMTHIPADCPFKLGQASEGRLCSPRAGVSLSNVTLLPSLYFQLEDSQELTPPKVALPLERLVFTATSSQELICVARSDSLPSQTADMMYSHIAFGSLAIAALYTAVDLVNHTVGLAAKGDPVIEASDDLCAVPVTCTSSMQTYYPPLNMCEDPDCSQYIFMTLDEDTKMCRWSSAVPLSFVALLVGLAGLDLISHRLYKQAIQKASDFCQ